jgi:hypothetical protein
MKKCLASIPFIEVFSVNQPCLRVLMFHKCFCLDHEELVWWTLCLHDIFIFRVDICPSPVSWGLVVRVGQWSPIQVLTFGEPLGWSSGSIFLVIGPLLWYFLSSHLFYYVYGQVPGMAWRKFIFLLKLLVYSYISLVYFTEQFIWLVVFALSRAVLWCCWLI